MILGEKIGGKVHIDIGFVDENFVSKWNVPDTTHLMLDKDFGTDFIDYVKKKRGLK